jgi:hypothetical protein
MDVTVAKPLVSSDTTADFGHDTASPISEASPESRRLIAKRNERLEIVEGGGSNDSRPSQKTRGNSRNGVETKKAQLADVDWFEGNASQNLLSQQKRRRVPQVPEALQRHART